MRFMSERVRAEPEFEQELERSQREHPVNLLRSVGLSGDEIDVRPTNAPTSRHPNPAFSRRCAHPH
jgi:hypothetical protein